MPWPVKVLEVRWARWAVLAGCSQLLTAKGYSSGWAAAVVEQLTVRRI